MNIDNVSHARSFAGTATLTVTLELAYTDARAVTADALERLRARELPPLDFVEEQELITRNLENALYEVLDPPAVTAGSEHLEVLSSVAEVEVLETAGEAGEPGVAHFLAGADRLHGVDFLHDVLVDEDLPPGEAEVARRDLDLLKGVLAHTSARCVDGLLEDVRMLEDTAPGGGAVAGRGSGVLARLPRRFGEHYTASFAKRFLVALLYVPAGDEGAGLTARARDVDSWFLPSGRA